MSGSGSPMVAHQALGQVDLAGGASQEPLGGLREQLLAGPVHQAQPLLVVKGEHGHVDLRHHGAQER